jgi:arginase
VAIEGHEAEIPVKTPKTVRAARVDIIGVPMDLGASRRGVDMGPSAVRYAKLFDQLTRLGIAEIIDHGNLDVPIRESLEVDKAEAKYFDVIQRTCDELAAIGGDHSIAMGTLAGLSRAYGEAPGLVWIDAHADINNPQSSRTGNVHGMPVWFALKNGFIDPTRRKRAQDPRFVRHGWYRPERSTRNWYAR